MFFSQFFAFPFGGAAGVRLEMLVLFIHPALEADHFVCFEATLLTQNPLVKMKWQKNRPWVGSPCRREEQGGAVVRVQFQTTERTFTIHMEAGQLPGTRRLSPQCG